MTMVLKSLLALPSQLIHQVLAGGSRTTANNATFLPQTQQWLSQSFLSLSAASSAAVQRWRPQPSALTTSHLNHRPSTQVPSEQQPQQPSHDNNETKRRQRQRALWSLWNQAGSNQQHTKVLPSQVEAERYHKTRHPIVMCHGLFGFDKLGPEALPMLQLHYWSGIAEALRNQGCKVYIARVPALGTIEDRARHLDRFLQRHLAGQDLNLVCHSMGGLDARYLLSHRPSRNYTVRSLTTIATPHRGSPVMDWFRDTMGLGADRKTVSGVLARLAAPLDAPAYANLTTEYLTQHFNPSTPDNPSVKYYSYGAAVDSVAALSPFRFTWEVVRSKEGANDGVVSVHSARWGEYIETVPADHFDLNKKRRMLLDLRRLIRFNRQQDATPKAGKAAVDGSAGEAYRRRLEETMHWMYGPHSFDDFVYGYEYKQSKEVQGAAKEFDSVRFYLRLMDRLYRQGF